MKFSIRAAIAMIGVFVSTAGLAQVKELPAQCMKSFDVKERAFKSGNATMSCKLTELRRGDLFSNINALGETGEIDGNALSAELAALEAKLKKEQDAKNWIGMPVAITGNALATIGLAGCLPTMGAMCALAAIGKVLSIVGLIDSATSEVEKAKLTASLRQEIETLRKGVESKKSTAKALRDRMVAEFEQLCTDVQKQCL